MTPGARVSAAIECLDQIFDGTPAEKALTGWARRSRFAGSKDRAAVRDHVFDALRSRDTFATLGGALTSRAVMIGLVRSMGLPMDALFNGEGHAPQPLDESELNTLPSQKWCWDMPDWSAETLQASHPKTAREIADALKERAPVDLRVNRRKSDVSAAIDDLLDQDIAVEVVETAQTALRITQNPRRLKMSDAYLSGKVELQDVGSQALVETLPLANVKKVLDYCAGGGGKSLAMAALTDAQIFAHDVNEARMKDIPVRAERAGVDITCVSSEHVSSYGPFDLVFCDAPCSGSGAWRRSPDAKWRLTKSGFVEVCDLQSQILKTAQGFVSKGGYFLYATCSLFAEENEDQVNAFLKEFSNFELVSQRAWTPLDGSDGFFVALMKDTG